MHVAEWLKLAPGQQQGALREALAACLDPATDPYTWGICMALSLIHAQTASALAAHQACSLAGSGSPSGVKETAPLTSPATLQGDEPQRSKAHTVPSQQDCYIARLPSLLLHLC